MLHQFLDFLARGLGEQRDDDDHRKAQRHTKQARRDRGDVPPGVGFDDFRRDGGAMRELVQPGLGGHHVIEGDAQAGQHPQRRPPLVGTFPEDAQRQRREERRRRKREGRRHQEQDVRWFLRRHVGCCQGHQQEQRRKTYMTLIWLLYQITISCFIC